MAVTTANTTSRTYTKAPVMKIVNELPPVSDVNLGEMYLLVADSHADTLKIHIKIASGWLKTAALT